MTTEFPIVAIESNSLHLLISIDVVHSEFRNHFEVPIATAMNNCKVCGSSKSWPDLFIARSLLIIPSLSVWASSGDANCIWLNETFDLFAVAPISALGIERIETDLPTRIYFVTFVNKYCAVSLTMRTAFECEIKSFMSEANRKPMMTLNVTLLVCNQFHKGKSFAAGWWNDLGVQPASTWLVLLCSAQNKSSNLRQCFALEVAFHSFKTSALTPPQTTEVYSVAARRKVQNSL